MKKVWLLFGGLSIAGFLPAQELFSSGGENVSNATMDVTWSIGEPVIGVLESPTITLTEGMQQSNTEGTLVALNEHLETVNVTAFPVPFSENLHLTAISENDYVHYSIIDLDGREVYSGQFHQQTQLILDELKNGVYILRTSVNSGEIQKEIKLIKTN